jgi:DNA repair exonuclease SbcCD nuclease subunit
MSSVPERYAKDVLYQWDPKPIEGCFNILFLHQNIDPYVYSPLEPPSLNLSNLPSGFDVIVDGHIHSHTLEKINSTNFIIPGSTVVVQFQPSETAVEKGFVNIDIGKELKINFVPLEKNRKFFYEEVKLTGDSSVREQIEKRINNIVHSKNFFKPPIIRIKVVGKEIEVLDQELRTIEKKYSEKAIVVFAKELESPEITEKIEFLRNLREQKLSLEEIGLNLLKKNLEDLQFGSTFDDEQIFGLLIEGEVERTFNILTGEQKTLTQMVNK